MRKHGNKSTTENSLQGYLEFLNNTPQLTPKEERHLLGKMSEIKYKTFEKCSKLPYFRLEVVNQLKKKIRIDKVGKPYPNGLKQAHVTVESQAKLIEYICDQFLKDGWKTVFPKISITGNFATSLINVLENKYKFMVKMKDLDKYKKFFKVKSDISLFILVTACLKNPQLRAQLSTDLNQTTPRVLANLQGVVNYHEMASKLRHQRVSKEHSQSLSLVHKYITEMEKAITPIRQELANRNLRLVVARAKYFIGRGFDFESIVQEGNLGLLKALDKYSLEHKTKLSTYATWWIDQTILRAIANKSKTVRIPTHIQTLHAVLKNVTINLTDSLGREPTEQELAEKLEIGVTLVRMLKNVAQYSIPLEQEMEDGTVISANTNKEDPLLNPFHTTSQSIMRSKIRGILSQLDPLFEKIIRLKFGIGEEAGFRISNRSVAKELGLDTSSTVYKLNNTLKVLKNNLDLKGVE